MKTRLAASVGNDAAAAIAHAFIDTLIERLRGRADACVLGFAPADAVSAFRQAVGDGWRLAPQCDGDLGDRMRHHFQRAFDDGADCVVLLGADSPNVPLEIIAEAFKRLEQQRLVLGPTGDGGYYLIGARREAPESEPPPVFDEMPWSQDGLWEATTDRLGRIGWREGSDWSALPPWYDVDTIDDLTRLQDDLRSTDDASLLRLAERLQTILPQP